MIKLGLVGKNIQHSLSPKIYQKIYGSKVSYDLLDFATEADVPTAKDLLEVYQGINITSPYKKTFLGQVELTENAKNLEAINCLKKSGNKIIGENTDYLAIVHLLEKIKSSESVIEVVVLGDGVMSSVTEMALSCLFMKYTVISRKRNPDFFNLDLAKKYSDEKTTVLVINTCAREYVFRGTLPRHCIFWDYNYNFEPHRELASDIKCYLDGTEMLQLQAQYAVAFWSFI